MSCCQLLSTNRAQINKFEQFPIPRSCSPEKGYCTNEKIFAHKSFSKLKSSLIRMSNFFVPQEFMNEKVHLCHSSGKVWEHIKSG
jgi:hypothetical protein